MGGVELDDVGAGGCEPITGEDELVAIACALAIEVLDGVAVGLPRGEAESVKTIAAVQHVCASPAIQCVVAIAAIEGVGSSIAVEHIVVLPAIKRVIAL